MCLAIPGKVLEVTEVGSAILEIGGTKREALLQLVPEVKVGDWVLTYLGHVVARIEEEDALETQRLLQELTL